ncbi:hypothetical protein [Deinococcus arcticus]|uniref:hypothetical protein n=1 Tax=Deinococcus arcticus TaxID=2136176 RepID=UPI0011B2037D|nr:hypothetical protein [Deinococcus arcticus]
MVRVSRRVALAAGLLAVVVGAAFARPAQPALGDGAAVGACPVSGRAPMPIACVPSLHSDWTPQTH